MTSTSTFTLFKLPWLCVECVLSKAEASDLICFSLISKKCYRLVKVANTPVMQINTHVLKEVSTVDILGQDGNVCGKLVFNFNGPQDESESRIAFNRSINDELTDSSELLKHYQFISGDLQKSFESSVHYFMDLFKCGLGLVNVCTDAPQSRRAFLVGHKTCEHLFMLGETLIENDELKSVVENMQVKTRIILDAPVDPSFHSSPDHFNAKLLRAGIRSGAWITKDFLLNLNSIDIHFGGLDLSKVNADDFMTIVDRWYYSGRPFKILVMNWLIPRGDVNIDKYNPKVWDENRRSQYYRANSVEAINLSEGHDIQRTDGSWATIAINKPRLLMFCVWSDMFPNLDGADLI